MWVRHNSFKSSATLSYQCAQYLRVSANNGMVARVWDLLTCVQMLMHAILILYVAGPNLKYRCDGRGVHACELDQW